MEQKNYFKNFVYVVAALAGAGLIIYGAFFYSKKPNQTDPTAQVLPQTQDTQAQDSQTPGTTTIDFAEPYLGNVDAPVTVIEYGSYLCSHCVSFAQNVFPQINDNYIKTGKIKYIFRSYPPFELGQAVLCANDQNKFWEYHDYAMHNTVSSPDDLKKFAEAVGLNMDEFNNCYDNKKYDAQAQEWYQAGQNDGIEGTPTFLVNGQKLVGEMSYGDFSKALDQALAK
jgi:protein-disulfide isomerase